MEKITTGRHLLVANWALTVMTKNTDKKYKISPQWVEFSFQRPYDEGNREDLEKSSDRN